MRPTGSTTPAAQGFSSAVKALGSSADDDRLRAAADDLLARWTEPHRRYHDTEHLAEVLDRLDQLDAATPAVVLAAWFHDAVYTGAPGDDERASAALAESVLADLGVAESQVRRVRDLVLATLHHDTTGDDGGDREAAVDPERAALLDADLGVLASHPDRYRRYVEGVRAEYAHVDDARFAAGRLAVLERLLERESLFTTPRGRALWHDQALRQVMAEITALRRIALAPE